MTAPRARLSSFGEVASLLSNSLSLDKRYDQLTDVFLKVKVTHFQRKPNKAFFSIERIFEDIRESLPIDIEVKAHHNRFPSKGLWRRIYDIFWAAWHQADINHITGDIHFISYLLKRKKTVLTVHDYGGLEHLHGTR